MRHKVQSMLHTALEPLVRRLSDRVHGIEERMDVLEGYTSEVVRQQARLQELSEAYLSRHGTTETLLGRSLSAQQLALDSIELRQATILEHLTQLPSSAALTQLGAADLDMAQLDGAAADFLNRATGWRGFASRAGVYVNEPINYVYEPGSVKVLNINERIAELPFVFAEAGKVPPPARVLDIGCSESPVSLGLATLGHQVVAVDPRGYAFAHPNISVAPVGAQELVDDEGFDLVVMLSTIEHIGLGHYFDAADDRGDFAVMDHIAGLVRPGARLVLTTPFGPPAQDELQRTYDEERLGRLLEGWTPEVVRVLERVSDTEWKVVGDTIQVPEGDAFRVAMVSAVREG